MNQEQHITTDETPITDKVSNIIDKWNDEIQSLKAKGKKTELSARRRYNETISSLEEKKKELESKLRSLQKDSQKAWCDVEKGVKSSVQRLSDAFKEAKSRYLN